MPAACRNRRHPAQTALAPALPVPYMNVHSYGILLFRRTAGHLQVLLVHPGGPFWAGKDAGAWSIPKGLPEGDEAETETARREFR